jgi:hypothetical protein
MIELNSKRKSSMSNISAKKAAKKESTVRRFVGAKIKFNNGPYLKPEVSMDMVEAQIVRVVSRFLRNSGGDALSGLRRKYPNDFRRMLAEGKSDAQIDAALRAMDVSD